VVPAGTAAPVRLAVPRSGPNRWGGQLRGRGNNPVCQVGAGRVLARVCLMSAGLFPGGVGALARRGGSPEGARRFGTGGFLGFSGILLV